MADAHPSEAGTNVRRVLRWVAIGIVAGWLAWLLVQRLFPAPT